MTDIGLKDGEHVNQLFSSDAKIIQNREVFSYPVIVLVHQCFPKLPARITCDSALNSRTFLQVLEQRPVIIGVEIQERLADMATQLITLNALTIVNVYDH